MNNIKKIYVCTNDNGCGNEDSIPDIVLEFLKFLDSKNVSNDKCQECPTACSKCCDKNNNNSKEKGHVYYTNDPLASLVYYSDDTLLPDKDSFLPISELLAKTKFGSDKMVTGDVIKGTRVPENKDINVTKEPLNSPEPKHDLKENLNDDDDYTDKSELANNIHKMCTSSQYGDINNNAPLQSNNIRSCSGSNLLASPVAGLSAYKGDRKWMKKVIEKSINKETKYMYNMLNDILVQIHGLDDTICDNHSNINDSIEGIYQMLIDILKVYPKIDELNKRVDVLTAKMYKIPDASYDKPGKIIHSEPADIGCLTLHESSSLIESIVKKQIKRQLDNKVINKLDKIIDNTKFNSRTLENLQSDIDTINHRLDTVYEFAGEPDSNEISTSDTSDHNQGCISENGCNNHKSCSCGDHGIK